MNKVKITFVFALIVFLTACRPAVPVPKPLGYFKIDLPAHQYQAFDRPGFPFTFRYPVYGTITQDSELIREEHSPYWLNINFPNLDATIYLSYKNISKQEPLSTLIDESYKLSYAHDIRADYIKTPQFITDNGLMGVFYNVGGNAASAYQFFITDTISHFVRGSLYFNVTPNADSLRPGTEFLKQDMDTLIQSFRFQ
jgi:gliding motility-associated lipoprotein GldD